VPDQEAIEVALADLSDVNSEESESSTSDFEVAQPETEETEEAEQQEQVSDEAEESDGEDAEKETETKSQRRRRLRREREQAKEAEIARLQRENQRLEQRAKGLQPPRRDQFYDEADYTAALAAYNVRRQDAESDYERINTEYSAVEEGDAEQFQESLTDFNSEGSAKYKDFVEKVSRQPDQGGPQITHMMAEAMMESDVGVDVAYYLATHVKESNAIAKLPPMQQIRALYDLEAKVSQPKAAPVSKAPPPVKPVRGGSASASKPVSEMSMAEYYAHRKKQLNGGE